MVAAAEDGEACCRQANLPERGRALFGDRLGDPLPCRKAGLQQQAGAKLRLGDRVWQLLLYIINDVSIAALFAQESGLPFHLM